MQPLHCVLQHYVHHYAAITMRLASFCHSLNAKYSGGTNRTSKRPHSLPFIAACSHFKRKKYGFVLRLPPQYKFHKKYLRNHFNVFLQHHIINDSYPRAEKHNGKADYVLKQSKPQPPPIGGATSHGKDTVPCSGFLPNTQIPCNAHVANAMHFTAPLYIHRIIAIKFASPRCRAPSESRLRVKTIQTGTAAHRRYPSSHLPPLVWINNSR